MAKPKSGKILIVYSLNLDYTLRRWYSHCGSSFWHDYLVCYHDLVVY